MSKSEAPVISRLSDKGDEVAIPSGLAELDAILGGGFYRGRLTEVSGNEGVGKTHLLTKLMANMAQTEKILFIDAEFGLSKERVVALGADPKNIDYMQDSRLEEVCEQITNNIGEYDLIILDSLASLIPMTVADQGIGESANIGLYARLIKQFVMKMRPRLGRSKTALVVINQMRKPIGMYARTELPGGMAWGHSCDVRLRLETNSGDKIETKGHRTGHWVRAKTTKNKVAQPFVETKFRLDY